MAEEEQTMSLRDRCKAFYQKAQQDAMLRQGSPVDDLVAFVMSEQGRAADKSLEETLALVLYFADEEGREEFMQMVLAAKPNMRAKRVGS
jgi:hypothetical protein